MLLDINKAFLFFVVCLSILEIKNGCHNLGWGHEFGSNFFIQRLVLSKVHATTVIHSKILRNCQNLTVVFGDVGGKSLKYTGNNTSIEGMQFVHFHFIVTLYV